MKAQARPVTTAVRVQIVAPPALGATAVEALRARGIDAHLGETVDASADASACAFDAIPTGAAAVELATACARAAETGRPVCVLAPAARGMGRAGTERAAALAYLRAHGAAVAHDVDAWLEAIVLLVRHGLPTGPRTAVIAPAGSWLAAQAHALIADAELIGARPPLATADDGDDAPTAAVLYDPALGPPPASTPGMHVPVAPRGELAGDARALYGGRAAVAAIAMLGRAAERIAIGLGPAPASAAAELDIDRERITRNLAKLPVPRVGDHETKVLLAAYGVPITRQGVATTPSAAVKAARKAGYPVELKPWGNDLPTEPAGCAVEHAVTSDALVRRAYGALLAAVRGAAATEARGGEDAESDDNGFAVIVREAPPVGRELAVSFVKLPALGWTVLLDAPGAVQIAAAPAPLRLVDAQALAAQVVASRAGEPEPDRTGLANLLRRASHLVVDLDARVVRLDLPRVVVGGRGARTLVVDAWAETV